MTPTQILIEMNASIADSGRKLEQIRFEPGAMFWTLVFVAVVVLAAWRVIS